MKNKKVTNKDKIREALNKAGHPLSINEVSCLTGLGKTQVRNTANYYQSEIVPVGGGKIDLLTRAYKERGLRVTPSRQDIEAGIVHSDELSVYLWPLRIIKDAIAIGERGEKFALRKEFGLSDRQSVMSGFSRWYRMTNFQVGDDIIFRCCNLEKQEFNIFHLAFRARNEEEIARKNYQLEEIIYDFLKYTPDKSENIYFLARKALLRDLYLDEILPDELFRALSKNRYLLILEAKYRKVTHFNVGIKKYFHSHAGEYHPVSILEDEILGKYGYCTECENPMIWDKKRGWRSAREDEYFDIYLDKSFFKKGRN